jgi:hypothetical protein
MSDLQKLVLAAQWTVAKATLDRAKARESSLRKRISELFFPSPKLGTNRIELDADRDFKLQAKRNFKFKFDANCMAALANDLHPHSNSCPQWVNVFKQEWTFNKSVYDSCSPEVQALIDRSGLISFSDATPQFEIAPKAKAGYIG